MATNVRPYLVAVLLLTALLGGCLPIELSVSPKGEVVIPRQEGFCVFDPAANTVKVLPIEKPNQAAFAVFSPGGASVLGVAGGTGMGAAMTVSVIPTSGGEGKKLLSSSNLTYARWSPDGKYISVTRVSDATNPAVNEQLPELLLLDISQGAQKALLNGVSTMHRWLPDSSGIVTLQIASKEKDKDRYVGKLVKLNVANGQTVPLASVVSEKKTFIDLSPDGKKALMIALDVTKADEKAPTTGPSTSDSARGETAKLFEVDITTGAVRLVTEDALYALYSPKGDKLLLGSREETEGSIRLSVADATGANPKVIATDAAKAAGSGMGDNPDIYPTWLNEDSVLYLRQRAVYGTSGKNLQLMMIGADGTGSKDLQPALDMALEKK